MQATSKEQINFLCIIVWFYSKKDVHITIIELATIAKLNLRFTYYT